MATTANKVVHCNDLGFEFLNPNGKSVVVFNKSITAFDVKECIKYCILSEYWPRHSNITILCGHHTSEEGKIGPNFLQFMGGISKHVEDLKGEFEFIEQNYNFSFVSIKTLPTSIDSEGKMEYGLAGLSMDNLKKEFKIVLKSDEPNILVFASCFSKRSDINCVIDACGLYPALFLSAERAFISGGRHFKLDKQQRGILELFAKV